jgi:hypothetical protein
VTTAVPRSPVLVVGLIAGLLMGAAELIRGDEVWRAALATLIPIGYAVVVAVLARRSESASVLAGHPVDERWEHINLEASAWAFGASAIVVLAAFVVMTARHGDWAPFAFIGAVMAVAYVGSLVLVRVRH